MASNKASDVKFIAVSRLTDKKVLLAMNPDASKAKFSKEVSISLASYLIPHS